MVLFCFRSEKKQVGHGFVEYIYLTRRVGCVWLYNNKMVRLVYICHVGMFVSAYLNNKISCRHGININIVGTLLNYIKL